MRAVFLTLVVFFIQTQASFAQTNDEHDRLFELLGLEGVIGLMRDEGKNYGADIQSELLEGRGGQEWSRQVDEIYDQERLANGVRSTMRAHLEDDNLAPMIAFFDAPLGRKIIELELSGRKALMNEDVEQVAREIAAQLIEEDGVRIQMIHEFVETADLVESNVVSALNSNYNFYKGLAEGGALPGDMSDEDILADVWAQEAEIREDTSQWLYAFLTLTYQPLSEEELRAYVDFFSTPEGLRLNNAIFAAFDDMFGAIGLALGSSAANFLTGQEL